MNWTGGRLQRHSKNAGGGVASRQKQHFAKIRTQLQNGAYPGHLPFRPSFLQENDTGLGDRLPPFTQRTSRHIGRFRTHQKKTHRALTNDGEDDGTEHRDTNTPPGFGSVINAIDMNSAENGKGKRKAQLSRIILEDELLESNRKRLLARRDWLGLESSRPVRMKFRTRTEKEKIGKRRKIIKTQSQGRATENSRIILPLNQERDECSGLNLASNQKAVGDYLRVRIGTDAFASQRSSTHIQPPPHRESSDTMLFDITPDKTTGFGAPPERSDDQQHILVGTRQKAKRGTALGYDNRPSANLSIDPHSARGNEHGTRLKSDYIEELHERQEIIESDASEPDFTNEILVTRLPNFPATGGRLIFRSMPPPSLGSYQPAVTDVSSNPAKMTALGNTAGRVRQERNDADQKSRQRQIADEVPWKQILVVSDDVQSQSSISDSSERAGLHGAEAVNITASIATPIGKSPGETTWVIARSIGGRIGQECTSFERRTRITPHDEIANANDMWREFILGKEIDSASETVHDAAKGDGSLVNSARGTSMKALYSSTVEERWTGSMPSSPSRSAAPPRLRNIQAGRGQSEMTGLRPANLASASLYNSLQSEASPVAAAYSNTVPTNYANSDVSMAESGLVE